MERRRRVEDCFLAIPLASRRGYHHGMATIATKKDIAAAVRTLSVRGVIALGAVAGLVGLFLLAR